MCGVRRGTGESENLHLDFVDTNRDENWRRKHLSSFSGVRIRIRVRFRTRGGVRVTARVSRV